MKKTLLSLLLISLLLAACATPATETPAREAPAKPERTKTPIAWSSIKLTQSGGLAGVSRIITFSQDGRGSAVDERAAKNVEVTLTAEQVAQMDALVQEVVKLPRVALESTCVDCFVYALEVSSSGKTKIVQLSEAQLAASGFEALVTFLRALMDVALQ